MGRGEEEVDSARSPKFLRFSTTKRLVGTSGNGLCRDAQGAGPTLTNPHEAHLGRH
jgi:hypothetical protein